MIAPRILLVTDPAFTDDFVVRTIRRVAAALPPGAFAVQLRDKTRPLVARRVFAWQLRRVTRDVGAPLIVNGAVELARDVGADGVHLGRGAPTVRDARSVLGGAAWISVATHSDDDVRQGVADGADALLVSPIFPTRSRDVDGRAKAPRGLDAIRTARVLVGERRPRPVLLFALGGVTIETAGRCAAAGAYGAALIRGILDRAEPARSAHAIHDAMARP